MMPQILSAAAAIPLIMAASHANADTIRVPADHPTIQAAVDAASEGDRILVAAGTYRERIALKPGITVRSDGDDTAGEIGLLRAERTVIDGGGAGGGEAPGVAMAEGSAIDGFTVTHVGAYDDALWQKHWEERGENQDHAHIGGFGSPGIGADGVSCRIAHCIVHHIGHTGIALGGREGADVHPIAVHNICFRNMGGGIGIMAGAGGIVQGNRCYENFYAGIGHSSGSAPLVAGNTCYGNIRAGIGVSEGACPVVRDNDCYANRRAGIGIRTGSATRPVIENNRCRENGMAGIGTEEEAEPILRGNLCEKNEMAGIGAQEGAKPLIVANECRANAASGIGLRPGCTAILWKNTCEANAMVAIGLPENARAIIAENKLSREGGMPPLVAIKGGSEAILIGNELKGGGVAGILVEGHAILGRNKIEGANDKFGQGIWLWKGSAALAAENEIAGFKQPVSVAEDAAWIGEKP